MVSPGCDPGWGPHGHLRCGGGQRSGKRLACGGPGPRQQQSRVPVQVKAFAATRHGSSSKGAPATHLVTGACRRPSSAPGHCACISAPAPGEGAACPGASLWVGGPGPWLVGARRPPRPTGWISVGATGGRGGKGAGGRHVPSAGGPLAPAVTATRRGASLPFPLQASPWTCPAQATCHCPSVGGTESGLLGSTLTLVASPQLLVSHL